MRCVLAAALWWVPDGAKPRELLVPQPHGGFVHFGRCVTGNCKSQKPPTLDSCKWAKSRMNLYRLVDMTVESC